MWLLHTVYQTRPGRPMHLPQGSARLDIVGYERHVDDNGNDDELKNVDMDLYPVKNVKETFKILFQ